MKVILAFSLSSAYSAIIANTLMKQLLWCSLTHFGTLTWLLHILNLQGKSSKKFSKPGQYGTSAQESSGPGANLGKAKAWSGGTLELEPLWSLEWEGWHDMYPGVTLSVCEHMHTQSFSCVWLFVTPWTVACQTPRSTGFPWQEHCSGLPFPPPGGSSPSENEPVSPAWQADSLPRSQQGSPGVILFAHFSLVTKVSLDQRW